MTTFNHTALTIPLAIDIGPTNALAGELDAAIGDLSTLPTTPKTSVAGAIGSTPLGTTATTLSGSMAEAFQKSKARRNLIYRSGGAITWNVDTKILTFVSSLRVLHAGSTDTVITTPGTIDFSGITSGKHGIAYIPGVVIGTNQTFTAGDIVVMEYESSTALEYDDTVIIVAVYTYLSNQCYTPFMAERLLTALAATASRDRLLSYRSGGAASWDPTAKTLTFTASLRVQHNGNFTTTIVTPGVIDFSATVADKMGVAYIRGVVWNTTQNFTAADIHVEQFDTITHTLTDDTAVIIAIYWENIHTVWSPFVEDLIQTDWLSNQLAIFNKRPWVNYYPQIGSKLNTFCKKLMNPAADVKIVVWGDSIFARETHTSAGTIDPTALPPMLITKNFAWYLWNYVVPQYVKATYRRYDYTGAYFTEVGTWVSSSTDAAWDDATYRPGWTRLSKPVSGEAGSFAWTLGITDGESGCNLIYRTDTSGDAAATIAVAEGNGYLEYWTGAAWAEANAATFSMLEVDEGDRRGNTIYQKRLKLRKAAAHLNASVTITVSRATADTDRLLYWGVELYDHKNSQYICQLINVARGSHTLNNGAHQLYDFMDDDVLDMDPDLVVFEIPLINMMGGGETKQNNIDSVQDVVWGDRAGNTNTWNLKTISNSWADFQALLVIPHYARGSWDSSNVWQGSPTHQNIHNGVKALIALKNDVSMIDIAVAMMQEIDSDGLFDGDYYAGMTTSSIAGTSYTDDATHPNNKGTMVYARHICPALMCNTI
jgi:predicted ribosome-associated RNA-binding protein Tma20